MSPILERTDVWNDLLSYVKPRLQSTVFDTWFKPVICDGFDPDTNTLCLAANKYTSDWVSLYYADLINDGLDQIDRPEIKILWKNTDPVIGDEDLSELDDEALSLSVNDNQAFAPANTNRTNFVDIETVSDSLNPKYTFEKFVVGSSNQFAHAASMGASETPGKTYNPLFIYGGVGLGKTHLMHAIGHAIKQRDRHMRVSYVTSEKFMNELINAIRYDKTQAFRDKYRSIDVLLMDDIQFIAGKERTQEEFFHTFNALHNDQKQIVISSDCPPRDIPTLQERLHSRFEWGLIADIEPPDLETKVAILKRKADLDGIFLPDDIAIYIASKIRSNVRELEGSLVRLVAISSLRGVPISRMVAEDAMKNIIDSERPDGLTMERIAKVVASHYKMTVEELKSKSNARSIAQPRQIAMYLCKRLTKSSYPEIGKEFGGKHHTTVMHSFEKIDGLVKEDRDFHKNVSELIDILCS